MKTIVLSVLILLGYMGFGQGNLNDYKYIIVPKQFDGFKRQNQYKTSTLVKHLFAKKGFETVYDDALPDELYNNRCLGLTASLQNGSSMFTTKTAIALENCRGEEVFVTKEGKSKIKEYNAAFSEAINDAMMSFNGIDYVYSADTGASEPVTVSFKNDVKKLEEKSAIPVSVSGKENKKMVKTPKNISPTVTQKATHEEQSYKNVEPVVSDVKKAAPKKVEAMQSKNGEVLYAQPLQNGYQLVDSTPKIRMKLLKSSNDNVYMAQSEGKSGMVYQKEDKWIFEYYSGDKLVHEELNIKF